MYRTNFKSTSKSLGPLNQVKVPFLRFISKIPFGESLLRLVTFCSTLSAEYHKNSQIKNIIRIKCRSFHTYHFCQIWIIVAAKYFHSLGKFYLEQTQGKISKSMNIFQKGEIGSCTYTYYNHETCCVNKQPQHSIGRTLMDLVHIRASPFKCCGYQLSDFLFGGKLQSCNYNLNTYPIGIILANALIFLLIGGGIGLFVLRIGLYGIKLHESNIYQISTSIKSKFLKISKRHFNGKAVIRRRRESK